MTLLTPRATVEANVRSRGQSPLWTAQQRTLALEGSVPPRRGFLTFLGLVLLGYALAGRGFAYVGLPPVFIGEISLLAGLFVLANSTGWAGLWEMPQMLAVLAFVLLGMARTAPFISSCKMDALRDAAIYYYSAFAFIVGGLIIANPLRLLTLLELYRRFVKIFLVGILVVFCVYRFLHYSLPSWPWGGGPMVQEKEGDAMVLSLIHISEPTRQAEISYAVFCLKKKNN